MEISQARSLVTQVRHAHRLLEGFYERILPQLDKLASEAANANFRFWGSMEGEGIGKSTSKPSSRAAWSFLPLFSVLLLLPARRSVGACETRGHRALLPPEH